MSNPRGPPGDWLGHTTKVSLQQRVRMLSIHSAPLPPTVGWGLLRGGPYLPHRVLTLHPRSGLELPGRAFSGQQRAAAKNWKSETPQAWAGSGPGSPAPATRAQRSSKEARAVRSGLRVGKNEDAEPNRQELVRAALGGGA